MGAMARLFVMFVLLMVIFAAIGWVIGEYFLGNWMYGFVIFLVIAVVMNVVAYFYSDKMVLKSYGAQIVGPEEAPKLYRIVERVALKADVPMPRVAIIPMDTPNAFATGRNPDNAVVAATGGLLRMLNDEELEGVIAHEMAHVKNQDVKLMVYAGVLVGAIVILAEVGFRGMLFGGGRSSSRRSSGDGGQGIVAIVAIVLMILAPILARFIYFAISRKREYLADASAASFTRYPEGLASALEKISHSAHKLRSANSATAPMYIINPLKRTKKMAANASSTHPPIDQRIRILRSMGGGGYKAYDEAFRSVTGKGGVMPGSALKEDTGGDLRGPVDTSSRVMDPLQRERARQVDDLFYKKDGWERISCPCGTVLKLPPDFDAKVAKCPHCGRGHKVG